MDEYQRAALRLHTYIEREHSDGQILAGPDPGIRFNARIGRFLKSYLPFVPWSDDLVYLQAQGYWIMDNWILQDLTGDDHYRSLALDASHSVLDRQTADGYWPYPNPEWEGRIATVEGCFAALGLLESYSRTGATPLLEGALAWFDFLKLRIGFRRQEREGMLAVNYFADLPEEGGGVPNNSTLLLWLLARLFQVTEDDSYLEFAVPMARWLAHVQVDTGELPYYVGSPTQGGRRHFLCHQYNAFEFMDLAHYHRITGDDTVLPVMGKLAEFLSTGVTDDGFAKYDCTNATIEVVYYTSAVAQALSQATDLGFGDYSDIFERAYDRVLRQQEPDGSFRFHSRANYRFLQDRRSYPRYLAMILHHLVLKHHADVSGEQ